jgi:hypothetical protein
MALCSCAWILPEISLDHFYFKRAWIPRLIGGAFSGVGVNYPQAPAKSSVDHTVRQIADFRSEI